MTNLKSLLYLLWSSLLLSDSNPINTAPNNELEKIILRERLKERAEEYNRSYENGIRARIINLISSEGKFEEYIKNNLVSLDEMCSELLSSKVVIFSDVEFSSKQKEHYKKILLKMGEKKIIAGIELFCDDVNGEIKKYIHKKITEDEFYRNIGYEQIIKEYERFGYRDLMRFLRKEDIETVGINKPFDKKIIEFLKKMSKEGKKPPYEPPEGFALEEIDNIGCDYYERDKYASKIAGEFTKNSDKTFVMIIGAIHGDKEHIPKMLKESYGLETRVVEWNLSGVRIDNENLTINNSIYERLKRCGLDDNNALRVREDFVINFSWNPKETDDYKRTFLERYD
ncbi:MAG: ChaN family lipoprotein [Nanoarchaeota archaeon]